MHNIAALSEIERLGQAVLDAMYAEALVVRPEVMEILKQSERHGTTEEKNAQARTVLDRAEQAAGMPMVEYITQTMRAGDQRQKAVNEYLAARRVLTSAGVL